MSLSTATVRATAAVTDLEAARGFYEGRLGLTPVPGGNPHVATYRCGEGSLLQVYASPEHAGTGTATVASWSDGDHDTTIDALIAAGVAFERYPGLESDARGVHVFGAHHVAWCKDPDGNVLAIDNGQPG